MEKTNCIILTGAPGSGKSTLIAQLRSKGFRCIDEPARQILAEQRLIGGSGVPEHDFALFVELMLSRTTYEYRLIDDNSEESVFFDRGIADNIAYAKLFELTLEHGWKAATEYRFNPMVFFTPSWAEIYCTDEERKMSFEAAAAMGEALKSIYQKLGYSLREIPMTSPQERVDFVLNALSENSIC